MTLSTKEPKHVKWIYLFDIGMKMQVEVRYWDSSFMGHCTSHDLKNHFNERISELNLNKILQVSMDGPSINLKLLRDVQSNCEELELLTLIDIGSCSLTQFMVHSKWELNQLAGELTVLLYLMILLLEEVTTPVSLGVLYSHSHFAQPGGSGTKRWQKD